MPVNEVVERLVAGRALVGYVSDIEGNLAAWNKYLDTSAVLYRETHADHDHHVNVSSHASGTTTSDAHINRTAGSVAALRDGCHFVFGGDVCDRGNGDIRILQDLIHLKQKYPDRVHFIMGNRDVNKLRLPVALHAKVCASKPQAYWTTNTGDEGYEVNDLNHKMKWVSAISFSLEISCLY